MTHTPFNVGQVCNALTLSNLSATTINKIGREQATNGGQRWKMIAALIGSQVTANLHSYRKAS